MPALARQRGTISGAPRTPSRALALALALGLAACDGPQSALDPAGRQARELADLFQLMMMGAGVIWLIVMALIALALVVRIRARWASSVLVWTGGLIAPIIVLGALLIYTLPLMPRLRAEQPGLVVEVSAEQFWWRFKYYVPGRETPIESANELRLPVGRPTDVRLRSPDVIHSFWIPALAGKMDAIPGRINRMALEPERVGVYRGQCAELCGTSHAFMAFDTVVMEPADFDAWLEREALPARDPATPEEVRGAQVFADTGCAACHAIRGTQANGGLGPDLTHLGSRRTVAAGILPMNRGTIAGWVAAAQQIKPGSKMPSFPVLSGADLRALGTYLESLE